MVNKVTIIGTVGVPGSYGGFETLADNLVKFHELNKLDMDISVFCSSDRSEFKKETYLSASLRYINIDANGISSVLYDIVSMVISLKKKDDYMIVLGVSGAIFFPIIRLVSKTKIISNIDGIEWRREKWKGLSKVFLRWSEFFAVRFAHVVITDNKVIEDYVLERYGRASITIPYGGDHALLHEPDATTSHVLPPSYALCLCRIEPENNTAMILEAWVDTDEPLVFVGNWERSEYGRSLKEKYKNIDHIYIVDPIYEPAALRAIRNNASLYVHGHSAGGTNPSLVEMMHFEIPVIAFDCGFNRETTENAAEYFTSSSGLKKCVESLSESKKILIGKSMLKIALMRYSWDTVAGSYFSLVKK